MAISTATTKLNTRTAIPGGFSEVAALAYPTVLQMLSDSLMQVVDAAIVGHLGVTPLAAVGFGGIWLWTMTTFFVGTATGVQTFVAQSFGAGRQRDCGTWPWYACSVLLPAALVWAFVLHFALAHLFGVVGSSNELASLSTEYTRARLFGLPAIVIGITFASLFRGLGRTRVPLLAGVIANVVNAIVAYTLVRGEFGFPAFGVSGAGYAMALANWLGAAVLVLTAVLPKRFAHEFATRPCRIRRSEVIRFLRTSAPIGAQYLLDMITFALFATIVAGLGDAALAANQVMIQLLALSFMQAYGISIASGALVGRYLGARDLASAERSNRSALQLGMAMAALVASVFILFPDVLLHLFTDDVSVIDLGRRLLVIAALFQFVDAYGIILAGSLRGAGDTRWPFVIQTTLGWLLRLPLIFSVVVLLNGGVVGAWMAELSYILVLAIMWHRRFRSGAWRSVRI